MTVGPTRACIPFHCDGTYATSTVQVALNDPSEYEGGRLLYFCVDPPVGTVHAGVLHAGTLHEPHRAAGSMTEHAPQVLHAVTCLHKGVRKSLFVLDASNGLGDKDVLDLSAGPHGALFDQVVQGMGLPEDGGVAAGGAFAAGGGAAD